ncbi:MAG: ATP-binding protein [bacterium]
MIATSAELFAVLRQYNPWWGGGRFPDLPDWRRAAFHEITTWAESPPAGRALLLSGPRQVGKTTLFLQTIDRLLDRGIPPENILYVTLDHPLFKLVGLEHLVRLWREYEPQQDGPEYLFLDEIQITKNWQTWVKHQVDFEKRRRIALTGSATPLTREGQESGVGRWQTIRLATLSFYEYLMLRKARVPELPEVRSLQELFEWPIHRFAQVAEGAQAYVALFHDYLLRGGFPQSVLVESVTTAQKLLREDIVDKVLKRDMTALFGVRRVVELEHVFLYLCLHDGALLDLPDLCKNLSLNRPTVASFIDLLEATHLIYRLMPFGYGKEVLRGRSKVYLADPAIGPSVLLRGKALLEDDAALGVAVESAFFKHAYTHYYSRSIGFSYWRNRKGHEVDVIAQVGQRLVPFEVKYRATDTGAGALKGLTEFCERRKVERAYVITKDLRDFGALALPVSSGSALAVKIPASLACYWLGRSELTRRALTEDGGSSD